MSNYFNPWVECATFETMRGIQSERLADTVRRCYENVPFYRKSLDDAGVKPEDIKILSAIEKALAAVILH